MNKKPNQAQIFLLDDLQQAKREHDDQIEHIMGDMQAISCGLAEVVDGEHLACTRDFLVRQLDNHMAVLRSIVLPGA